MSAEEVKFSVDARDRMLRGIDTLAHAVHATLGPKGRKVVLDKPYGAPRITRLVTERNRSEIVVSGVSPRCRHDFLTRGFSPSVLGRDGDY
jgi:hypothetical protein